MNRFIVGIAVGGFVAAVAAVFVAAAQPPPHAEVTPAAISAALRQLGQDVGRFQIVDGTPQFARNIMLLDTVTGDSWITCAGPEVGDQWCRMPRGDAGTLPKK